MSLSPWPPWLYIFVLGVLVAGKTDKDDVAGPVVKLQPTAKSSQSVPSPPEPPGSPAAFNEQLGNAIQEVLSKEFQDDKKENAGAKFNNLVAASNSSSSTANAAEEVRSAWRMRAGGSILHSDGSEPPKGSGGAGE